ncbi:FAD-binding oxidoreductase [Vibrio penaeicida]|uniref:FAD-binding oxidoreductase n=1 Tax=Vibrio penaeicida TaxID=104609 RepID=UPI000CEA1F4F|nr:FAD-binding oxidoreductase [Vibrio penaeicida]
MSHNVKITPSDIIFQSEENVLQDALDSDIVLEHSCMNGDCGVCETRLVEGKVENDKGEVIVGGSILTCKTRPLTDIVIEANFFPELAKLPQQTLPCKVSSISFPANDIAILRLRYPPSANFEYMAGQYLELIYKGVKRSYSIANIPDDTKEIELHIRKVSNGQMSDLIFDGLREGQLMRTEGPKGTFFVRPATRPLIFLATGTGIAPVKAMVEHLVHSRDERSITVYWGMRTPDEIYSEEFIQFTRLNKRIVFVPVLSRSPEWDGRTGYVQNAVVEDVPNLEHHDVYACGSLSMIESSKCLFSNHKLPPKHFYSDAFTPSK